MEALSFLRATLIGQSFVEDTTYRWKLVILHTVRILGFAVKHIVVSHKVSERIKLII